MKRFIMAVLFVLTSFAGQVTAAGLDTTGLTEAQARELAQLAAKMKADSTSPTNISAEVRKEATAWAELGGNIGVAMVSAAKEVGIAADEFSRTGLGKVVTTIVVYKIVGKDLVGIAVGSTVLIIGLAVGLFIIFSKMGADVVYENRPILWGAFNRKIVTSIEYQQDAVTTKLVVGLIVSVIALIVGLTCIF